MTIKDIAREFGIKGEYIKVESINEGHINNTYKVYFKEDGVIHKYILQRINKYVFKKPYEIMDNISRVSLYMKDYLEKKYVGENNERYCLRYLRTKSGSFFYVCDNEYYRVYNYIDDCKAYNNTDDVNVLFQAGKAFGEFQAVMKDFDVRSLYITIPKFHDTIDRYNKIKKVVESDKLDRVKYVNGTLKEYLELEDVACKLQHMLLNKELPIRVTHNDTKCNNVLIDNEKKTHLAVIDLDTVMPGLMAHDFGDSVRSGCNTSKEDEIDLSNVSLDLDKFESYARGFLVEVKDMITGNELMTLADSPIVMTIECGLRFLTDYLMGDKYFRTSYPGHNLDRSRCQLKLAKDMIDKKDKMDQIIKNIIEEYNYEIH